MLLHGFQDQILIEHIRTWRRRKAGVRKAVHRLGINVPPLTENEAYNEKESSSPSGVIYEFSINKNILVPRVP